MASARLLCEERSYVEGSTVVKGLTRAPPVIPSTGGWAVET